ncbi:hypothetical protein SLEP1_g8412 [Rubroshorea leprosula]|uniref:Plant bHLH transcription factor ACT-like domain-containing protein n=1 Tax=Rubroshorea leprosula TaxID=152421 RepID=A0AAV5IBE8_9ROSI|nr:hypothetical protein SLEP1_g8412 [Rubroshorea leprosula]
MLWQLTIILNNQSWCQVAFARARRATKSKAKAPTAPSSDHPLSMSEMPPQYSKKTDTIWGHGFLIIFVILTYLTRAWVSTIILGSSPSATSCHQASSSGLLETLREFDGALTTWLLGVTSSKKRSWTTFTTGVTEFLPNGWNFDSFDDNPTLTRPNPPFLGFCMPAEPGIECPFTDHPYALIDGFTVPELGSPDTRNDTPFQPQEDVLPVNATGSDQTRFISMNLAGILRKELKPDEVMVRNTAKFDVERREKDTTVDICCAAKPRLLPSTVSTLETLGLEIQQCVISCFNDFSMQASCSERTLISFKDIKQALFRNAGYEGRCLLTKGWKVKRAPNKARYMDVPKFVLHRTV